LINVPQSCTWTVNNPAVLSIGTGVYEGVAAGTTQVTATLSGYDGFSGSQTFDITVQ